jgi:hypothetical protein
MKWAALVLAATGYLSTPGPKGRYRRYLCVRGWAVYRRMR